MLVCDRNLLRPHPPIGWRKREEAAKAGGDRTSLLPDTLILDATDWFGRLAGAHPGRSRRRRRIVDLDPAAATDWAQLERDSEVQSYADKGVFG